MWYVFWSSFNVFVFVENKKPTQCNFWEKEKKSKQKAYILTTKEKIEIAIICQNKNIKIKILKNKIKTFWQYKRVLNCNTKHMQSIGFFFG